LAIDGECDRRSVFAALEPRFNDVASDGWAIHSVGEVILLELAPDGPHAGEIRFARSKGDKRRQITLTDQVRRRRSNNQVVVIFAEPTRPWRRRHADEGNAGGILHPSEDLFVHLVRLVDDDEIDVWSLATGDRLDAAHLDRLIAIRALMDALHDTDAVNAFGLERSDCLVDERDRRHDERDALSLVERGLDCVRRG